MENRKSGSTEEEELWDWGRLFLPYHSDQRIFFLMSYPGKWREGVTWEELSRKRGMQVKGPSSLVLAALILP